MALINCKECNKEMSNDVKKCPSCGKDQRNWFMKHKVLTFIGGLIAFVVVVSVAAPKNNNQVVQTTGSDNVPVAAANANTNTKEVEKPKPNVPIEYTSALAQAYSYANTMHMSKKGVYDQLVSQYGGKFTAEAAQYAIDNVKTDWKAHAIAKAKTYQDTMHMSPSANHDQLTSPYGEKFTQEEADYAIEHLND